MREILFRPVCVLLFVSLSLAGCQAPGSMGSASSEPLTAEEARLRQQNENFALTVAEGAVAGAALGALIGGLVGGWRGAAVGAGVGGLTGGATGAYVASKQREYANEEARIDSMVADVQQDNDNLRQYIATAEQVIEADKQKLAGIETQLAAKEITRTEAQQKLARIKDNGGVIEEAVENLRKKKGEYEVAAQETRQENPTANLSEMDRQIAMLEGNIEVLERDLDSLNEALAVSPVG
jgi:uncharacterized protein YcfJ